jgi:amidophosphoribosyltransferase
MGIDMSTKKELIAAQMTVEEICDHVGADSLIYLSVEEMKKVVQGTERSDHCTACFSGKYPIPVCNVEDQEKFEFEQIQGE